MKKLVILSVCFAFCVFPGVVSVTAEPVSVTDEPVSATAEPVSVTAELGDREIIGTHLGSSKKQATPWNMVLVPAGKVKMGMPRDKALELAQGYLDNLSFFIRSTPEITVKVDHDYFCDLHEVTNAQWKLFLDQTGGAPSKDLVAFTWKKSETFPEKKAHYPVRNVSLYEARAFARWCGKRIPTEVEWHRAAAGDDGRVYSWGPEWDKKCCTNRRKTLSPVGSFENGKSPFGIYDMTGSVWEWTDSHIEAFKGYKPIFLKIGKKKDVAEPGFNAQEYVIKGGCYYEGKDGNRLDIREKFLPTNNLDSIGFRCVKGADPGNSLLAYAKEDLQGSIITEKDFDTQNLYTMEITELTDGDPKLIMGFKAILICPLSKALTTTAKIIKDSPDNPFRSASYPRPGPSRNPTFQPDPTSSPTARTAGAKRRRKPSWPRRRRRRRKRKRRQKKKRKRKQKQKKKKRREKRRARRTSVPRRRKSWKPRENRKSWKRRCGRRRRPPKRKMPRPAPHRNGWASSAPRSTSTSRGTRTSSSS